MNSPVKNITYLMGESCQMNLITTRHTIARQATTLLTAALLFSCGGESSVDKSIGDAEIALIENDYGSAATTAEKIAATAGEPGYMTARQAARLSIIYMQLADHANEDTNTAIAVNYCREALKENSDTAEAFYAQLPPDQIAYGRTLMALVQNINNPEEIRPDTVPVEPYANIKDSTQVRPK